jgi:hypothetical protein
VILAPGRSLIAIEGALRGLAWSPDGRWLATGSVADGAWLLLRPGPGPRTIVRSVAAGRASSLAGWTP